MLDVILNLLVEMKSLIRVAVGHLSSIPQKHKMLKPPSITCLVIQELKFFVQFVMVTLVMYLLARVLIHPLTKGIVLMEQF